MQSGCVCACVRVHVHVCVILKYQMLLEKPLCHLQEYLSHLKSILETIEQFQSI